MKTILLLFFVLLLSAQSYTLFTSCNPCQAGVSMDVLGSGYPPNLGGYDKSIALVFDCVWDIGQSSSFSAGAHNDAFGNLYSEGTLVAGHCHISSYIPQGKKAHRTWIYAASTDVVIQ